MRKGNIHKYVLTGGPGSGKSTLLQALHKRGYSCSQEASRQLIMEELARNSDCLPWADLPRFAEKVLPRMVEAYHAADAGSVDTDRADPGAIAFFDRGVPDIIAYLKVAGIPVQEHFHTAMQECPYEKIVFLLPPWRDIYVQDQGRRQTFEESERLFCGIRGTYEREGYRVIELPRAPVEKRANFIQAIVNRKNRQSCANSVY
jgi:predicted ATPase